jgi:lysophospholipase L1-like esterase
MKWSLTRRFIACWEKLSVLTKTILLVTTIMAVSFSVGMIIWHQRAGADIGRSGEETSGSTPFSEQVVEGIGASSGAQKAAISGKKGSSGGSTSGSAASNGSSSSGSDSASDTNGGSTGTTYLVALGDSLTNAAALQPDMPGDNKSYSFSTGTSISSLYLTLKNQGWVTSGVNLAVSGATSASCLSGQAPNVAQYSPPYVTILIGGNDIIQLVAPSTFQANLSSIASQVRATGRRVLIGNLPNYTDLVQAPIPACQANPLSPEQLAFLSWGLAQYNSAIASVASQYGFTLVDLFSTLGQSDISEVDCIHINIQGQQKMANRFSSAL